MERRWKVLAVTAVAVFMGFLDVTIVNVAFPDIERDFAAASLLCGLAPSAEWLVAARVLQAAAGAILVPTSLALLLPEFPPERRATAVAIWSATGAVAAALGPSLGGVLVDLLGWRWVFLLNVPIGLAALVPARRLLREARDPAAALPDALGSALLVAGVGPLALGILKGADWGWGSGRVIGAFAAAAGVLPAGGPPSGHPRAPRITRGP